MTPNGNYKWHKLQLYIMATKIYDWNNNYSISSKIFKFVLPLYLYNYTEFHWKKLFIVVFKCNTSIKCFPNRPADRFLHPPITDRQFRIFKLTVNFFVRQQCFTKKNSIREFFENILFKSKHYNLCLYSTHNTFFRYIF